MLFLMARRLSAKPSFFRRRSLRLAAAVVMFLGLAATLRAVTVLDNTFDEATSGLSILRRDLTPTSWYATPFTTDGFAYKLNSIKADIEDFGLRRRV